MGHSMSRCVRATGLCVVLSLAGLLPASAAPVFFYVDTPYLSMADIPVGLYAGGSPLFVEDFEDGTIDRVYTAEDFSETGELRFRFLRASDGYTAACHYVRFYQNGFLIKPE